MSQKVKIPLLSVKNKLLLEDEDIAHTDLIIMVVSDEQYSEPYLKNITS